MSSTASSRTSSSRWRLACAALLLSGCATGTRGPPPAYEFHDTFEHGLAHWHLESEQPARVQARDGVLDIDTPAGLTLWFKHRIEAPVRIEFDALAVAEGGPNDQVSDLNVFFMASNTDGLSPVYARSRSGRFEEYHDLLTYYVGLGGNRNTTSRFRRYIGDPVTRPLRPEHDLSATDVLLRANVWQTITLMATGGRIEYHCDGKPLFVFEDPAPYASGWFALRTTYSHLRIDNLRISRIATPAGTNR